MRRARRLGVFWTRRGMRALGSNCSRAFIHAFFVLFDMGRSLTAPMKIWSSSGGGRTSSRRSMLAVLTYCPSSGRTTTALVNCTRGSTGLSTTSSSKVKLRNSNG
ncbi:hypothetical protein BJY04DRAFT_196357 [Aspergillus karnatakaensis]|uniref:uncharacterized protein n=1 Tax=Aspergillus karnatakaensis TaxID=1810916 RepID=UPI003CCCB4A5